MIGLRRPINRILVANRGEIAARIIRACDSQGIESILAVSAADRDSLPARQATRAVCIGPGPARDSYLRPDLIVQAALGAECDAIHPGYGFLSEQSSLASLCAENCVSFIGPDADTIELLGNKLAARNIAEESGVPLLPGSKKVAEPDEARSAAAEIGYPILIKAASGGGGRGMKVVRSEAELESALVMTATEAEAAFGDATLYVEKFLEDARHVEVQVLGDESGNVVHLGERDCSLQRCHQKVIEEAPATNIPDAVLDRMRAAAIGITENVKYVNAGTIEFLYDKKEENFYFLEMNTRLQVEHPVTEMVTGVDIVAEQIRVGRGETLGISRDAVVLSGHAIEARITAEVPEENFRPSPGRITAWQAPAGDGIRVDTYCESGSLVPPFYDSMIAKIIVLAPDRFQSIKKLSGAIEDLVVEGIATNREFLLSLLADEKFVQQQHNTRTIDDMLTQRQDHDES